MTEVLDWQRDNPRLVLQRAVDQLAAGRLVVFPTEAGYCIAGSALHPEALASLGQLSPTNSAILAVRDAADAMYWAPPMSPTARRLARRVWPGPVILIVGRSPEAPAAAIAGGPDAVHLRVPAHEAALSALQYLPGPMVFLPVGIGARTVEELAATVGNKAALLISDGPLDCALVPTIVRVNANEWQVVETGAITTEMLRSLMLTAVVFVCTGNTCRSPLAEGLCKKLLAERHGCTPDELPERGFEVASAGLAAIAGAAATPEAVEAARAHGADLSEHQSQPLSADLLARADYLFTMTQSHLRVLASYCVGSEIQPQLLARDGQDIADPIGAESAVYSECARQILQHLKERLPEMQAL